MMHQKHNSCSVRHQQTRRMQPLILINPSWSGLWFQICPPEWPSHSPPFQHRWLDDLTETEVLEQFAQEALCRTHHPSLGFMRLLIRRLCFQQLQFGPTNLKYTGHMVQLREQPLGHVPKLGEPKYVIVAHTIERSPCKTIRVHPINDTSLFCFNLLWYMISVQSGFIWQF